MDEQTNRCPYCVVESESIRMLQRPAWYICEKCGHTVIPDDPDFKCSCLNCWKLRQAA
jgi:hypothetical protein